jgi:AbrB family looped-hinge helix DNA binding protein
MILTMTTTLDANGTITIPQELLEEAGLKPGTPLEITCHQGRIEIEPAASGMRLEKRGRLTVLVPEEPIAEPMTNEQLLKFIDEFRNGKWD